MEEILNRAGLVEERLECYDHGMKTFPFKRVLVTGGAGFIGSELVRQLTARGAREIVVISNLANGRRENIEELLGEQIKLVEADIRDRACMIELMNGIEIVFHLACLGVRHSIHSPLENHDVNATGTLGLLHIARAAGVKRFVHVSSSEVYGTALHVPMTEEHPTFPMTVYGASKLAGEAYARAFFRTYGFPTVVVRPFNTYGPRSYHAGDSGEVIPKFMLRAMAGLPLIVFGDGSQTRDFTYVSDTARGIMFAALKDAAIGETINLGSGSEISLNQLAQIVAEVVGRTGAEIQYHSHRPGDTLRLYADITKAKKILGLEPKVSLKEGLALLHQWYQRLPQNPETLLRQEVVRNWEK